MRIHALLVVVPIVVELNSSEELLVDFFVLHPIIEFPSFVKLSIQYIDCGLVLD